MPIPAFMQEDQIAGNTSLTAPTGANFLAVAYATVTGSSTAPTFTWNSVSLTEAVDHGGSASRAVIYYLQVPDIGTHSLNAGGSGWQSGWAFAMWFRRVKPTGTVLGDTAGEYHAANDVLTATVSPVATSDVVIYAATKNSGNAVWGSLEDGAGYTASLLHLGGAYEIPSSAAESATFGDVGTDSQMAIAGAVFLQAKVDSNKMILVL